MRSWRMLDIPKCDASAAVKESSEIYGETDPSYFRWNDSGSRCCR